jgi:DNA repair photolyase
MSLKISKGNMYPWVTHMHAHLGGECSHKCSYCYVDNPIGGRLGKFQGPIRLLKPEFDVKYGSEKAIFIEHCNDLFASDIPDNFIDKIIKHTTHYPKNFYVFQTKNPIRYKDFLDKFPPKCIVGCTIETNRDMNKISKAPNPFNRYLEMKELSGKIQTFITCEPILDFDIEVLANWIVNIKPVFVNIGADSKNHNLEEPSIEKVMELGKMISDAGIEVKEKRNLDRLRGK